MTNFDRQVQEIESKMNGQNQQPSAAAPKPQTKRPNYSSDRTQQQANDLQKQSADGISGLVLSAGKQEAQSLQRVDATLTNFEETMSDRLADRISQVGTRVTALTLQKLQQRQQPAAQGQSDICIDVETMLMSLDIPELTLPPFRASALPQAR